MAASPAQLLLKQVIDGLPDKKVLYACALKCGVETNKAGTKKPRKVDDISQELVEKCPERALKWFADEGYAPVEALRQLGVVEVADAASGSAATTANAEGDESGGATKNHVDGIWKAIVAGIAAIGVVVAAYLGSDFVKQAPKPGPEPPIEVSEFVEQNVFFGDYYSAEAANAFAHLRGKYLDDENPKGLCLEGKLVVYNTTSVENANIELEIEVEHSDGKQKQYLARVFLDDTDDLSTLNLAESTEGASFAGRDIKVLGVILDITNEAEFAQVVLRPASLSN